VLVVEQDPVEPEVAQHLHHGGRGKGAHDAEGRLSRVEPLLEGVLTHDRRSIPFVVVLHRLQGVSVATSTAFSVSQRERPELRFIRGSERKVFYVRT
jgi:hypothetical protein